MAAIALIAGSLLGWIGAATALMAGFAASTALVVFLTISLTFAASLMLLANWRRSA